MDQTQFVSYFLSSGLSLREDQYRQLYHYHTLLMDWNTRMDLTAVVDEAEMLDRHYMDSLMPMLSHPLRGSVIDVGTGAGLPGIPLAIACPDVQFTLLDARQKRLDFLEEVIQALPLPNVRLVHARAEDAAFDPGLRAAFDSAVARAVAPLNVLAEYLLPFVRIGGQALCWKGPSAAQEIEDAEKAVHLLGGHIVAADRYSIPGREWQHALVVLSKSAATPKRYPRKAGLPSKSPLGHVPV